MKTTLLIMAAGIGSRFGTGIKQLEPVDYAFQDINDIPGTLPEGRTKPWGTGQAVLAAKKVIKTPFIVINADDYYGKEGFKAVHEYLVNGGKSCMAGFVLKNTLSDNGGVTRGICKMDEDYNLTEVVETKNIVKTATGAEAEGMAVDVDSLISMNMWGLTPDFLTTLEEGFKEFFEKEVPGNPLKAEYLIPIFIGELLEHGKISVKVLKTNDTWYQKFKESVFFRKLFLLFFVTSMILFRTLLNRNLWMNPLSKVMGGWGIWETVNGEQKLTTECIENVIMMVPFSSVVMWTFKEKTGNGWKKILWYSGKIAFIFSVSIEMLQLLLRLGTFQLSDIFYNTVGGMLGGLVYYVTMKARKHL